MSHRTGLPIVVAIFVLALAVVASSSSAQTIMRKPNEGRPSTLEASSGQVPREGPDPDGYEYIVQAWDRAGRPRWTLFGRRATEPGAVDRYELTYSLSLTPPIWIAEKRDHSLLTVFLHGVRQGRSESAAVGELVLAD